MSSKDLTLEQQLAVCQQVAKLVRAKLPIAGELSASATNASKAISDSAQVVDQRVAQGKSLAEAIAGDPSRESRILAACIEAGERSATLDRALEGWTSMHIANSQAAKAIRTALIYPSLLILVTLISLSIVIWNLIPEYRQTYLLFDQQMPRWLEAIVWIRERFGWLVIVLLILSVLPLAIWYARRSRLAADGLPAEPARKKRLQALASDLAANMLAAGVPLNKVSALCTQSCGALEDDTKHAFARLQKQQHIPPLARETSMLLASLHAGLLPPSEAADNLRIVAEHLRQSAEITAARHARWIPMLVALTVGFVTILTYVFLIYLPWVWLLQRIVVPVANGL